MLAKAPRYRLQVYERRDSTADDWRERFHLTPEGVMADVAERRAAGRCDAAFLYVWRPEQLDWSDPEEIDLGDGMAVAA